MKRIVIAATQSGSGKTTVVTGLLGALKNMGLAAQSYKIGPDYIDPGYHIMASGRPSHNLDTWLIPKEKLPGIFQRTMANADIAVIEGVMGLYDGGHGGVSSTAEVAKLLDAPVILVINAKSMGESAAALALGFREYDPDVKICGVILNSLGSETHKKMIEDALARIGIPVIGAIFRNDELKMPERHLGLLPVEENDKDRETVDAIVRSVIREVDVQRVIEIADSASPLQVMSPLNDAAKIRATVAVARDEAFSFYYPESLYALAAKGAEIVFFSPLSDTSLPKADALMFGGGFPEMFARELEHNEDMRAAVRIAAADGMPVYAECGGFMYLMEKITDFDGKSFKMTGVIPSSARMNKKLQTVGYVEATMLADTILGKKGESLRGHEFHFSSECELENPENYPRAFLFKKMRNPAPYHAGYSVKNVLGSYLHIHFAGSESAAETFVSAAEHYRRIRRANSGDMS